MMPGHRERISTEESQGIDYTIFHPKFLWFVSIFLSQFVCCYCKTTDPCSVFLKICAKTHPRIFQGKAWGGGVPGFSSIVPILRCPCTGPRLAFMEKMCGKCTRNPSTRRAHFEVFFQKHRLFTSLKKLKSFHLNFICTNTQRVVYIVCLATPAVCNACQVAKDATKKTLHFVLKKLKTLSSRIVIFGKLFFNLLHKF